MLKTVSSIANSIGALNYKGTWNASTNSPTLASGVGTKGDYYVVSVAGSTTLDGISNWGVGDWAAYNGSTWQRVEGGANLNGVDLSVSGTSTLSGLTASTALALNASKEVVSVANTGTGSNVLATAPTLVGDVTLSTGDLVIGTSGKGITNSTGSVSLDFSTAGTALSGGSQSTITGSFNNVGTAQTITIADTSGGYVVVTGVQGGVGSSTWTVPFVKRGGSIAVGTASKAILTADPIVSIAASSGNILVTPLAANTYLTYAIYYTPLAL